MSIFVSIASFCDEQLPFTLDSLFQNAASPHDITVGILDQSHAPLQGWLATHPKGRQIRYLHMDPLHSKGVCWARHLVNQLYDEEHYFLQIDSHTSFDSGWDSILISHLDALSAFSKKPVLTTYPPPFEFDAQGQPFKTLKDSQALYVLRPKPEGVLTPTSPVLQFKVVHEHEGHYAQGFHIAGGFIFASGRFLDEVPYDPLFYFHGEEQNLALRAYTQGWDIFHPRQCDIPLSHLYKRAGEAYTSHHWRSDLEALRRTKWPQRKAKASERLAQLVGGAQLPPPYGLGSARTLDEFIAFSGLDYQNCKIQVKSLKHFNLD